MPTRLTFVDIAGLVRGASKGEGLGNQFLANIREVDAIAHVVRCFEDADVTHVEGKIDPIADIETIETELMLADLDSLEKRVDALEKKAKGSDKEAKETLDLVNRALVAAARGQAGAPRRAQAGGGEAVSFARPADLGAGALRLQRRRGVRRRPATSSRARSRRAPRQEGAGRVVISAKIESEIAVLPPAERADYLAAVGLKETGLDRLIRAGYALLHLVTYFTAGPKEARAWTITQGTKAPQAAGVIHTDFERGFIRAETIAYDDYIANRRRGRRPRRRQDAAGRQGLRGRRRRRDAFPVCDVIRCSSCRAVMPYAL